MREEKIRCTLGGFEGLAHVVCQEYSPEFSAHYGSVDLCAISLNEVVLLGQEAQRLTLEDGRSCVVFCPASTNRAAREQGRPGESHTLVFFLALTPLAARESIRK